MGLYIFPWNQVAIVLFLKVVSTTVTQKNNFSKAYTMIKIRSMHAVDKKLRQAVDKTSNLIVASL